MAVVVEMRKFDQELDMQASSFCCGLRSRDSGKSFILWSKIERNASGPAVQWSRKRSAITINLADQRPSEEQCEPVAGGFCISGERIGCRRHYSILVAQLRNWRAKRWEVISNTTKT